MKLFDRDKLRFETKYTKGGPDDCWPWINPSSKGYGRFMVSREKDGRRYIDSAHRVAYFLRYPTHEMRNLLVCHSCDNPRCVNPKHLFLGEKIDNIRDMFKKGRNKSIGRPKLTPAEVATIRSLSSELSQSELARQFGVVPSTIHNIVRFKKWLPL